MKHLLAILALYLVSESVANDVALEEFTIGNNLFTGAIYRELLKNNNGNFIISPFSIQTVLALTQSGAKAETGTEIRTGLHLPNTTEAVESVYSVLIPTLKGNEQYALHTANKIYIKNEFELNENFKNVASNIYQAEVEAVDFGSKTETADLINAWVEKQTNHKINNLIDPTNLDDNTRAILLNALYFKGKWMNAFETFDTKKEDFHVTVKDVVQVETMHNTEVYNYYESAELNAKFLELPYQGNDVSMIIVLPNEKQGLASLENQIEKIFSAPNFTQERVSVSLPKFTIGNKVQLRKILENLGIKTAFTENADLSGIAGKKGDLIINDVIQKTFINVTETGTEAAAATAVIGVDRIGHFEPLQVTFEFIADHPFLFYIKNKNMLLFNGRVDLPQ